MKTDFSVRRKILESNMVQLQKKAAELKQKDVSLFEKQKSLHSRFLQVMAADTNPEPKKIDKRPTVSIPKKLDYRFEHGRINVNSHTTGHNMTTSRYARRRSLTPTMCSNRIDVPERKHKSTSAIDRIGSQDIPSYSEFAGYSKSRSTESVTSPDRVYERKSVSPVNQYTSDDKFAPVSRYFKDDAFVPVNHYFKDDEFVPVSRYPQDDEFVPAVSRYPQDDEFVPATEIFRDEDNMGYFSEMVSYRRNSEYYGNVVTNKSHDHNSEQIITVPRKLWNFDVVPNGVVLEHPNLPFPPPVPEIEALRSEMVRHMRVTFNDLCRKREGIYAPIESINRWLMERRIVDQGVDPLLPSNCTPELSPSLYREIIEDIPLKCFTPKDAESAMKQLTKFASCTQNFLTKHSFSESSKMKIRQAVHETLEWMKNNPGAPKDELVGRLTKLKGECHPYLAKAADSSVKEICNHIYNMSREAAETLHIKHHDILKKNNISEKDGRVGRKGSMTPSPCRSVMLALPSPPMPQIQITHEGDQTLITYDNDTLNLNTLYFEKLEQLYRLNCHDDSDLSLFRGRVWTLLRRYQTFFGIHPREGNGLQGALPTRVFEVLHREFGVSFECFASPLNCYFRQFCSAFPDTDGFFGSNGTIWMFHPESGSFEAAPPYSEEVMECMVDHFEMLLEKSEKPLSFFVFIPEWRDPPTPALERLETSRFNRGQLIIASREHQYRKGFQHKLPIEELMYTATHSALAVFLQNEAGYAKWTPTTKRMEKLSSAIGKSKSSLLS